MVNCPRWQKAFQTGEEMKAVIFDMDGVIIDSEWLVVDCWKAVARKYKIPDIEKLCRKCLGLNRDATIKGADRVATLQEGTIR